VGRGSYPFSRGGVGCIRARTDLEPLSTLGGTRAASPAKRLPEVVGQTLKVRRVDHTLLSIRTRCRSPERTGMQNASLLHYNERERKASTCQVRDGPPVRKVRRPHRLSSHRQE
jgi:hypothetical protein